MSPTSVTLQSLMKILDRIAPFSLAENWDNVGMMIGEPDQTINNILVGLDPTLQLLDEAIDVRANLIITHHPLIFTPIRSLRVDQPLGSFMAKAIANQVAVVGCHTNLDVIDDGVSVVLARELGLTCLGPLAPTPGVDERQTGFGQVGQLASPLSFEQFNSSLCGALGLSAVRYAGSCPSQINKVAVCGGSGSDLAEAAYENGADIYVTGEIKHSVARWAEEIGFCVVDAGHYATENLIVKHLVDSLQREIASQGLEISVHRTSKQKNPFYFYFASEIKAANI